MAHKKGQGSSRNGRDSNSQRLGVKAHDGNLVTGGTIIVLGQLSNYLYAPAAMILINRMLDPELVAYYEAAVQVDAALLLLVSSVATVLLPKAAVAHAADDLPAVRRYYVRARWARSPCCSPPPSLRSSRRPVFIHSGSARRCARRGQSSRSC